MRAVALAISLLGLAAVAAAQELPARPGASPDQPARDGELYRLVKRFDFDERKLGNYEDVPMHWERLSGAGLPAFSNGRFDEKIGHAAAPSFVLRLETGNVAYEYSESDMIATSDSDYLVSGYIRAENLRYARAFIGAYLVDQFGQRIPGSERISQLVESTSGREQPWQRVSLEIPGEFPSARSLRLQFWILQTAAWRTPDRSEVDPIIREDIQAAAWFDDVEVLRLPRARLRFSSPAGLVLPGRDEYFVFDVANTTAQDLAAQLIIRDENGDEVHRSRQTLPAAAETAAARGGPAALDRIVSRAARAPVPKLPDGLYEADLLVFNGAELLFERRSRFAVLAPLADPREPSADLGVNLGAWHGEEFDGLVELLSELGVGACKVGVAMEPGVGKPAGDRRLMPIGALIHAAAKRRIETIGVIEPPSTAAEFRDRSTLNFLHTQPAWRELMSPTFAHFGGMLPTWQLGDDQAEFRARARWDHTEIAAVREQLGRFVTSPEVIVPTDVSAETDRPGDARSVWIPASIPARDLPRAFDFLRDQPRERVWLALETAPPRERGGESQVISESELARRFVLAKACGAKRLFFDAPFQRAEGGAWEPTAEFPVVRTLARVLGEKELIAVMRPAPELLVCFFRGAGSACMVAWNWRCDGTTTPLELYLGDNPHVIDIRGRTRKVSVTRGRTRLEIGESPLIVDGMDSPRALFQASFRVAPTNVQQHSPEPRPVVHFRNTYDQRVSGTLSITPPENWELTPRTTDFELDPGEELSQPLAFNLPPREPAAVHDLKVKVTIRGSERAEFEFTERLTVGLKDIDVVNIPRWVGRDLQVEQMLINRSDAPIRFSAYCVARNRPRKEQFFIDVAPGGRRSRVYVFANAADLAESYLYMGIQELHGERKLSQLVEVPKP